MIGIINIVSQGMITNIYIIKIINPSPRPSPISITPIEHGKIESKNDIAKTVNVSFRLVKFLIKRKIMMATIMIIMYSISDVCYSLLIYSLLTVYINISNLILQIHLCQDLFQTQNRKERQEMV